MTIREKLRREDKSLQSGSTRGFASPWQEMEHWFDEFGRQGWLHPFSWERPTRLLETGAPVAGRTSREDMVEREGEVVIHAALPGVKKDDVEVTLAENTVTIEAHTRHEKDEESGKFYRREMSRGDFQRTLTLPCRIDAEEAKASFADGMLELTLPKVEKTTGTKVQVE